MEEFQNTSMKVEEHFCFFLTNLFDCTVIAKVNMSYMNQGQEMIEALGKNTSAGTIVNCLLYISVFTVSAVTMHANIKCSFMGGNYFS